MSSASGDEKYYSSSRKLPPIRDVVGDVLQQPISSDPRAPAYASTSESSSRRHSSISMYPSDRYKSSQSSSTLPPLRASTPVSYGPSSSSSAGLHYENGRSYAQDYPPSRSQQRPSGGNVPPSHAYHVFVTSDQGLVHQRSSDRDDFRQVLKEEAISMSTGKHACPECGRRFEKLSHYKSHLTTHSGERPYQCPWPGCGKTFSASSNMRRHQRTHGASP